MGIDRGGTPRRRHGAIFLVACLMAVLAATTASATPTAGIVRTKATIACQPNGGANVTFWVRNIGDETVTIEDEIVLKLTIVRDTGPVQGPIAYMLPIPELATIAPHGVSRFRVPMGDGDPGNPGTDFSGLRLRLRVDVYLVGYARPSVGRFRFPSCPAPA